MFNFDFKDRSFEKGEVRVCLSLVRVRVKKKSGVPARKIEKDFELQVQRKEGWA